jgi:hypothetical protein
MTQSASAPWFKKYALGLVLATLWLVLWGGYALTRWWIDTQYPPEEAPWWLIWLDGTFENNQSEFLQLLSFVVLTKFFIFKGSHESKDESERLERKVDEIRETIVPKKSGTPIYITQDGIHKGTSRGGGGGLPIDPRSPGD